MRLTLAQKRAWLTLEGWVPYPETTRLYPAAYNGSQYLYLLGSRIMSHRPLPDWLKHPTTWDDMPDEEVSQWFKCLSEEK